MVCGKDSEEAERAHLFRPQGPVGVVDVVNGLIQREHLQKGSSNQVAMRTERHKSTETRTHPVQRPAVIQLARVLSGAQGLKLMPVTALPYALQQARMLIRTRDAAFFPEWAAPHLSAETRYTAIATVGRARILEKEAGSFL